MGRCSRNPNPLPSWHPEDRESYASMIAGSSGCDPAVAKKVASAFPRGYGLADATPGELRHLGLSAAQAKRLATGFELARFSSDAIYERHSGSLRGSDDVMAYLAAHIGHLTQESFVVILIDSRHRVIDTVEVGRGVLDGVDAHEREIFRRAIQLGAKAIFVAHNHPSGDARPSKPDIDISQHLRDVGELIGIPLYDSFVVGRSSGTPTVTSLEAEGLLKPTAA